MRQYLDYFFNNFWFVGFEFYLYFVLETSQCDYESMIIYVLNITRTVS